MAYTSIDKGAALANTSSQWTGNDSTQTISGIGFQPDLTWIKAMTTTLNWGMFDPVCGATKWKASNITDAETTRSDSLTSWNADGFVLGSDGYFNDSNYDFRSWNFKAGTTSGLSGGTITPDSYSFNATSGVSILKWAGTGSNGTIAHGLGVRPDLVIVKALDDAAKWAVWHRGMWGYSYDGGEEDRTQAWNDNSASGNNATYFNGSDNMTSSVISLGDSNITNNTPYNYIAYCFASIKGFSKHSWYIGSGEATGPFLYCGFKPQMIMVKRRNGAGSWAWWDTKRDPYNYADNNVYFDENYADNSGGGTREINIFSNGFQIMTTHIDKNGDGDDYIWSAWGQPIIGTNGVLTTAF